MSRHETHAQCVRVGSPVFTLALRASVNSRLRLNFTSGVIIFHHSPHEQSIFVYHQGISEKYFLIVDTERFTDTCMP